MLIHRGKELEEKFAKDGSLPDPASTDNAEFKCILQLLKDSIPADKTNHAYGSQACMAAGSRCDGITRARDVTIGGKVMIGGKCALVCGYGDVGCSGVRRDIG